MEAGDENERKKQLGDFFETVAYQLNEEGLVVKDLKGHYEVQSGRHFQSLLHQSPALFRHTDLSGDSSLMFSKHVANGICSSSIVETTEGKKQQHFTKLGFLFQPHCCCTGID